MTKTSESFHTPHRFQIPVLFVIIQRMNQQLTVFSPGIELDKVYSNNIENIALVSSQMALGGLKNEIQQVLK